MVIADRIIKSSTLTSVARLVEVFKRQSLFDLTRAGLKAVINSAKRESMINKFWLEHHRQTLVIWRSDQFSAIPLFASTH